MLYPVKNDGDTKEIGAFRREAFEVFERMANEKRRFLSQGMSQASEAPDRKRLAQFALIVLMANDLAEHRRTPMVPLGQFMGAHIAPKTPKGYLDSLLSRAANPAQKAAEACRKSLRTGLCGWPGFSQEAFDRGLEQSDEFMSAFAGDYETLRALSFELSRLTEAAKIGGELSEERGKILEQIDRALMPRIDTAELMREIGDPSCGKGHAIEEDDGPLPA